MQNTKSNENASVKERDETYDLNTHCLIFATDTIYLISVLKYGINKILINESHRKGYFPLLATLLEELTSVWGKSC